MKGLSPGSALGVPDLLVARLLDLVEAVDGYRRLAEKADEDLRRMLDQVGQIRVTPAELVRINAAEARAWGDRLA